MARRDDKFNKDREVKDGFDKVTIAMNRVTKVVKGGRTMRQAALIVVGDKNGQVGLGMGSRTCRSSRRPGTPTRCP